MECKICFFKQGNEFFDHFNKKPEKIKLNAEGFCQKCSKALKIHPIFEDFIKKASKYSYDLMKKSKKPITIFLSGGKDSTVAVLKCIEQGWKINTLTVLKSPNVNQVENKIKALSEKYNFTATIKRIDSNLVEDFYRFCFKINISPCKYCGLLITQPVLNRFKLEEKPPIVIDGIDYWTVFNSFLELNLHEKDFMVLLQVHSNPFFQKVSPHSLKYEILRIINSLKKTTQEINNLKQELLELFERMEQNLFLTKAEELELQKLDYLTVPLTAFEFQKKSDLLKYLKKADPEFYETLNGETNYTDCKVGKFISAILSKDLTKEFLSYKARSGMSSKNELIEEMNSPLDVDFMKEFVKKFKIKRDYLFGNSSINQEFLEDIF